MRISSVILALALSISAASAADVGPLPPGAPAGVKHAQDMGENTILYGVLGAGAIAFIAYAVAQGGHTTLTPTVNISTSSTGTSP